MRKAHRWGIVGVALVVAALLSVGCGGTGTQQGDGEEGDDGGGLGIFETTPRLTVPAGTVVRVRLQDRLDSGETPQGHRFTMTVASPVSVDGEVAIPSGSEVVGSVTAVESAGRPNKGGRLEVTTEQIRVRGEDVPLDATIRFEGDDSIREDLKEIGIGGGVGAVVGGLLEGGKGAIIGGIAGAGGTFLATKGEQVELDPGTELVIELDDAIEVPGE